jgi:glutamine amidotransferase
MIAIIDYDMGNVGSVLNMFRKLGQAAELTRDHARLVAADGLILPGVGAFDSGMSKIHDLGLYNLLTECVLVRKVPILGICLGMQLLTERSEEGSMPGFGWIPSETVRFNFSAVKAPELRVPHMGWNNIHITRKIDRIEGELASNLFIETTDNHPQRFYFTHSFHVRCQSNSDVLATANYGYEFAAAIGRAHIAGTQFHPEKSHRYGLALLGHFARFVSIYNRAGGR